MYYNPYTGIKLDDSQKDAWFRIRMLLMMIYMSFYLVHYYLSQKALIETMIHQQIVERQYESLLKFFNTLKNCILLVNKEDLSEIVFQNDVFEKFLA